MERERESRIDERREQSIPGDRKKGERIQMRGREGETEGQRERGREREKRDEN